MSLEKIKNAVYEELTEQGIFTRNPHTIRSNTISIGLGGSFVGILLTMVGGAFYQSWLLGGGAAVVVASIVLVVVGYVMPQRSAAGRELLQRARGYKMFLSATEKYRQPFFEKEGYFMQVLPYAIVFGITKQLAEAFSKMGIDPGRPGWYASSTAFNPVLFGAAVSSFSTSLESAIASTPSSSGSGGFSGGGFGGGGGGSW